MIESNKADSSEVPIDGIEQLERPTPAGWAFGSFFVAAVVVLIFLAFLSSDVVPTALSAYDDDAALAAQKQFGSKVLTPDGPTLLATLKDPALVTVGQQLFINNCTACHGRGGEGIACPNLTDDSYLDVKKIEDITDVVKNGRKNGAMPAWSKFSQNELVVVSAYAASLRGKNLPGRAAEGVKIAEWGK